MTKKKEMKVIVNPKKCKLSGECFKVCPEKAILVKKKKAFIDQAKCDRDGICIPACPHGAISYIEE